ncbi:hypothetical protein [Nonomuraea sp. NPDC049400]|uniref:hypothetical protein n=1 Tax=Nonomuraea sp. NPDC049400 TaxID=3364352 RepID=UPI0037924FD2
MGEHGGEVALLDRPHALLDPLTVTAFKPVSLDHVGRVAAHRGGVWSRTRLVRLRPPGGSGVPVGHPIDHAVPGALAISLPAGHLQLVAETYGSDLTVLITP